MQTNNQTTNKITNRTIKQPPAKQAMHQTINKPNTQQYNQIKSYIAQSIKQPNKCFHHTSKSKPNDQAINKTINQTINHASKQTNEQPSKQTIPISLKPWDKQSINQVRNQATH